jgi:integrase/recombinase XerD
MSDQVPATVCDRRAHVLDEAAESFMTKLSRLGYCKVAMRQKRVMVGYFARWVIHRRLDIAEIDENTVDAFLVHLGRRRISIGNWRCTTVTFLENLREQALTPRPEPVLDDSREAHLLQRYETYLREERGLARETVCNYLGLVSPFARKHFMSSETCERAPGPGVQEVRDYLLASTRALAPSTAQHVATALRSFLRFDHVIFSWST